MNGNWREQKRLVDEARPQPEAEEAPKVTPALPAENPEPVLSTRKRPNSARKRESAAKRVVATTVDVTVEDRLHEMCAEKQCTVAAALRYFIESGLDSYGF